MTRPRLRLTAVLCEVCRATTTRNWSRTCIRCAAAAQSAELHPATLTANEANAIIDILRGQVTS